MTNHQVMLSKHYEANWEAEPVFKQWSRGAMKKVSPDFGVFEIILPSEANLIVYATGGMSIDAVDSRIELFLLSRIADESLIELLTAISFYHITSVHLSLGHTVNFGRPWLSDSGCEYGLLSLPYLYGPRFEWTGAKAMPVRILWLIPITKAEKVFKQQYGLEALEERFEQSGFDYLDWKRISVV